jgi:cytochrome c oxidase cbb3-type subunit 4
MFSKYLSSIDGVSLYAIIGLVLFVSMFVGVSIWVFRAKKDYITKMENMPLETENENN